jgi:hypothetical protein
MRPMRWGVAIGVAVLAACWSVRPAAADGLDDAIAKARSAEVGRLESIAAWTQSEHLSGFRHRVYRILLELAPDHAAARSALKYKRASKKDPWVQSPDYAEPPDWNQGKLPEGEQRLADALGKYRDDVIAALDASPDTTSARREETLSELVDLMPQDATLRSSLGHVQHDGVWVLPETVTGDKRRADLVAVARSLVSEARKNVGVDRKAVEIGWTYGYRSPYRSVSGDADPEASSDGIALMDAADRFCPRLFGGSTDPAGPRRVYSLQGPDDARSFVELHAEYKSVLSTLDLVGGLTLPDGAVLEYFRDARLRRTVGLRKVLSARLDDAFPGTERGWISEGVGQRIVWYLAGEHGPAYVHIEGTDRSRREGAEDDTLPEDPAEWFSAAARVLGRDGPKRLAAVLTMRLNAMRASDALVAHGLAAYLLEARHESFTPFLKASVSSDDGEAVVHQALDADVAMLSWRLHRWLLEAKP